MAGKKTDEKGLSEMTPSGLLALFEDHFGKISQADRRERKTFEADIRRSIEYLESETFRDAVGLSALQRWLRDKPNPSETPKAKIITVDGENASAMEETLDGYRRLARAQGDSMELLLRILQRLEPVEITCDERGGM